MGKRRLTEADYARMAELRESGVSVARIAAIVGCSPGWVNWKCLQLGAEPPNARPLADAIVGPPVVRRGDHLVRRFTHEEDAALIAMEREGLSPSAIGRRLGRTPGSVKGRLMTLARREARRDAAVEQGMAAALQGLMRQEPSRTGQEGRAG